MRSSILIIGMTMSLLFAAPVQAQSKAQKQGAKKQAAQKPQYGFNWFSPHTKSCVLITPKLRKQFAKCEESPGFGEHPPIEACKIGSKQEWVIYDSKKACTDEFETMKANGDSHD